MWVRSLGWEEPLEEEMVTHSSILAWKKPMESIMAQMGVLSNRHLVSVCYESGPVLAARGKR